MVSEVLSSIYLIKDGKPFWEPGDMRLIKNDPRYNVCSDFKIFTFLPAPEFKVR